MQVTVAQVIKYMVDNAQVQPDGSGVFVGTPRPLWETPGSVSSGPKYHALEDEGLVRDGRGRTAKWRIPATVMRANGVDVPVTPVLPAAATPATEEMPTIRLKKTKEAKKEA